MLQAPAHWQESQEKAGAALALEEIAWWKAFGDPVLNNLIEQAAKTNLDLEQARARLIQARADVTKAGAAAWPSIQGAGSVTRSGGGIDTTTSTSPSALSHRFGHHPPGRIRCQLGNRCVRRHQAQRRGRPGETRGQRRGFAVHLG